MNPTIARHCDQCKSYHEVKMHEGKTISCPQCSYLWGKLDAFDKIFENCPLCQCRQFYTSKDFNQLIGCFIMLIGIILVPWTYGISLPIFALIDWILHKRVPTIVNCYKCGSEFRHLDFPKQLKPFMHHIGLKYDKFRK